MPVQITCPECDRKLKVPDASLGKKIRCPGCKSAFVAGNREEEPAEPAARSRAGDREEGASRKKPRNSQEEEAPDEDERPRKKKRKKKQAGSSVLLLVLGVGGLVLVLAGGVVAAGFGLGWFGGKDSGQSGPQAQGPMRMPTFPLPPGRPAGPPGQPPVQGPTRPDQEAIQGKWEATQLISGPVTTNNNQGGLSLLTYNRRFDGNKVYCPRADGSEYAQTFRINPAATPKEMDIIFGDGTPSAETSKCIYELNGDTLRICSLQGPNQPRPKSFDESERQIIVLKRVGK